MDQDRTKKDIRNFLRTPLETERSYWLRSDAMFSRPATSRGSAEAATILIDALFGARPFVQRICF
jgi:hypothetical protein